LLSMSDSVKICTKITPRPIPRVMTAWLILAILEFVGSIPSGNTTLFAESLKTYSSANKWVAGLLWDQRKQISKQ
jgi:hypothetical protein